MRRVGGRFFRLRSSPDVSKREIFPFLSVVWQLNVTMGLHLPAEGGWRLIF
ncbi:hypothetical protein HMPREF3038_00498 [Akkermansia sp. KLE1797]|nr:hypothetical protein HMPREF3038_00498 [Akkermansia sp. KLE1797]KXU55333.1 hypothetical protein HMPREF3039_00437 [Akkermansia sp. KLE1798]